MAAPASAQSNELQTLLGDKFVKQNGDAATFKDSVDGNDLIGLYFSAHWCPPCKAFTPKLKECYEKWKSDGYKIEIIFGSSDKDEASFKSYFAEMGSWLAFAFQDAKIEELKKKYGVSGIPWLVIMDKNGKLLQNEADTEVGSKKAEAIKTWLK
eukprot:CAMPEP_0202712510 /NCGR_PEP_ID=MMETSP1385-20130828/41888_1 /ASSEMBLY_ACC=CAM_ASM_000861 /TAXON_ID=933848 /ORGANISM="Elphidium margaritaceum" /LENGTH=153 /DNA_ID=CAMNT_0049372577 /DNA_START=36 /DNA_END=497 /DNA_ORIENTATION=+